jgi:hypothetical protein
MMKYHGLPVALLLAASVTGSTVAMADDRPPTAEEKVQIEKSLRDAGYTIWEEIEFDDGLWEVDDARKGADKPEFDLKLDPKTYKIVVEREDR